eukprot:6176543-Pleurochrysis_carterae.AAC.2
MDVFEQTALLYTGALGQSCMCTVIALCFSLIDCSRAASMHIHATRSMDAFVRAGVCVRPLVGGALALAAARLAHLPERAVRTVTVSSTLLCPLS